MATRGVAWFVISRCWCRTSAGGREREGIDYSLLDDLVGEAIEGWRRDGRLVDAGATGVGRRGVHDALAL